MNNELTQKLRSKPVSTFFNAQAARSCYGALLGIEILESRNKLSSIKSSRTTEARLSFKF